MAELDSDIHSYFEDLTAGADACRRICAEARSRGVDPEVHVEIPFAEDLASRVEKLLSEYRVGGIADRIRELASKYNREEMSLIAAKEIALAETGDRASIIEKAVRVGLAILTEGILVAPLEGITGVDIKRNADGSEYVSIYFSGPIRSAGGTGQALSVLIADVVRRELNIDAYRATEEEVERLKEEIPLYRQKVHLQYLPTAEEIELIARNCPVCIDGEGTEEEEVSGHRNLPRIATNRLRGGACIVIADGLCQKASKLMKHITALKLSGWDFLSVLSTGASKLDGREETVEPSEKYVKDIVAGRPIFCHPSRVGGFRLRYGRGRTTGLAAVALNPATMYVLDSFIAIGTQIKLERPGKAGAVTPCDEIEGPIVLLREGSLVQINSLQEASELRGSIREIVDVGEILIPYGEFLENNHPLVPSGYTPEWHREVLRRKGILHLWKEEQRFEEAIAISEAYDVPLDPRFNLFWSDISFSEYLQLRETVLKGKMEDGKLVLPVDESKKVLETLGALHTVSGDRLYIERYAAPLLRCLGLKAGEGRIEAVRQLPLMSSVIEVAGSMAGVRIMPRAVTRIGARMARPEKAAERKMRPPPSVLFPLGHSGGMQRLFSEAAKKNRIEVEMNRRVCRGCGAATFRARCECGAHTERSGRTDRFSVDLNAELKRALRGITGKVPEIKGVQGLISSELTPEPLEKGVLRARRGISVFRDGTVRFDMTDVPLTHFRPREIGLDVERARALGYTRDIYGHELSDEDQVLELRVQDIIPSVKFAEYMKNVANFVDDELVSIYGMEPYYRIQSNADLIGHLAVGLAPHTSGGILCRIIGFTKANVGFGHPFFHAAKRRNADGDEDSVILLMDALLNFSRSYLPSSRGGLMDAPLILSLIIDPEEIDKEAHNIDVGWEYPLEFYEAAQRFVSPKEVEAMMQTAGKRIGEGRGYSGFGYTFDTTDIAMGPTVSTYTSLETMQEKLWAQLDLAERIRAVDAEDVAYRVITRHFLPDMIGNLKSFTGQELRCTKCGSKYRRIPLRGRCRCGHELTLTVHEASVKKYLEISKEMVKRFNLSSYTVQRIELIEQSMDSLFESDGVRVTKLTEFE